MDYDLALGGDDFGDDFGDDIGDDIGDDLAAILSGDEIGGKGKRKKSKVRFLRQAMPFPRTAVLTTVTTTVTAFPQRKMLLERFVFGSVAAASFTVDELKVGQDSMLVNTGNIPAEVFSQLGVGMSLSGYVANVGSTVSLTCTNFSGATASISAAIIGHVRMKA